MKLDMFPGFNVCCCNKLLIVTLCSCGCSNYNILSYIDLCLSSARIALLASRSYLTTGKHKDQVLTALA